MSTPKKPVVAKSLKARSKELVDRLAKAAQQNDPQTEKAQAEYEEQRDQEQQAIYAAFHKNKKP